MRFDPNSDETALIRRRVETGENVDDADVVHEALRLLTERDRELEELRAALQLGIDDFEAGRVVE